MLREINAGEITKAVAKLCRDANYYLPGDVKSALKNADNYICKILLENSEIAAAERIPICQDTGMTTVFAEIGQDVHITGGDLTDAINAGTAKGYEEGYLRKSVVSDPFLRANTQNNTPSIIHYEIKSGDKIKITVAPKGFGSENMTAVGMLNPSDGEDGAVNFILESVRRAGSNSCPPVIAGVGIGGTADYALLLSKKALLLPLGNFSKFENAILNKINELNIGPAGLGGFPTAIGVRVIKYPTHIAGLPIAVSIGCHAARRAEMIL
jgi:fumarate hydratase subunit alpha